MLGSAPMYVGRQHTAPVATVDNDRFVCIHCKYECDALVTGVGEGTGRSPYFLDNAGARDRARDEAVGEARSNMHWALAGATCPQCGKHDGSARWHVYWTSGVRGLAYGALVGALVVTALKGSTAGWVGGVIGLLVVAIGATVLRSQRMLTGAMLQTSADGKVGPSRSSMLGL